MRFRKFIVTLGILSSVATRGWSAMGVAAVDGTREDSEISGTLKFEDTPKGLKITGSLENVPSGEHAFHIHEFGDCGDEGKKAGGHFNPDQHPHGLVTKDGVGKAHAGDMGNVTADEKDAVAINITLPGVTLTSGKYSVAGRAIILHENKDDFGQPTGNAGGRVGCGPIILVGK
jgi:Cu-Zn family superoxide dismutase